MDTEPGIHEVLYVCRCLSNLVVIATLGILVDPEIKLCWVCPTGKPTEQVLITEGVLPKRGL